MGKKEDLTQNEIAKSNRREYLDSKIEQLEQDKSKIVKWVRTEEKKVEAFRKEAIDIRRLLNAEKSDLHDRKTEILKLLNEQSKVDSNASSKLSKLELEKEALKREKLELSEFKRDAERKILLRIDNVSARENKVAAREKFAKKLFKELKEFENAYNIE